MNAAQQPLHLSTAVTETFEICFLFEWVDEALGITWPDEGGKER
jgi:hypothetical protein